MGMPHVLVSGGGIAGPALAYWLHHHGARVTLVERMPGLRDEGQNIDVRGAGRDVARRMGIEDAIVAAGTGERGLRFVDAAGGPVAVFPAAGSTGPTAELEVLHGDLSRILHERTREDTEYLFGDRIAALDEHAGGVTVRFHGGASRDFDLVVLAEGLRSSTRRLLFPRDVVRHLGLYVAYLTIPRTAADDAWWRWYLAGRGRSVTLRPDNTGTTRASLYFLADVAGLDELRRDDQVMLLRRTFADAGWETGRVLAALADAPFYFESVGQAHLPRWSRGRVALAGDTAYCASPVSGMSTSLALVGAYVLAAELARGGGHKQAFDRYEKALRPYVARAQRLAPGVPRVAHPRTRAGVTALHAALRAAASRPVAGFGARLFTPPADAIELPAEPGFRSR